MNKTITDVKLVVGFIIAHLLLYFSFKDTDVFWYMYSASMLILISYSIISNELEDHLRFRINLLYGASTGFLLYAIFWIGYEIIKLLNIPLLKEISELYKELSPSTTWHFFALLIILIPGEEIFWRGFIQKRISKNMTTSTSIILSALLYSSVHLYSEMASLVVAALVGGLFWGTLYAWKKSITLVIISHLVFDVILLFIFPLI